MHRREFLAALAATTVTPQRAAQAQPAGRTYRIGMVEPTSAQLNATNLAALRRGLEELGYVEGRHFLFDYRSADGNASLYPGLVAEVIGRHSDLIIARGTPAALAVKQATSSIPVVMIVGEPLLVVDSLARPGGNITGLSGVQPELEAKRMELLKEIAPSTTGIAALLNMGNPVSAPQLKELQKGAQSRGWRFRLFDVRKREDIVQAFAALADSSDAIIVGLEALTQAHRGLIADLAAKGRLPAIYGGREFMEAGGLIFYGPSFPDIYRRAASYIDRIFKGTKPADLPVEQPTRFEMMINLKAAKAIGLEVPLLLQQRADEVIE
jgi:putative tryptophan/tyrosine transport system substrate-binding protein